MKPNNFNGSLKHVLILDVIIPIIFAIIICIINSPGIILFFPFIFWFIVLFKTEKKKKWWRLIYIISYFITFSFVLNLPIYYWDKIIQPFEFKNIPLEKLCQELKEKKDINVYYNYSDSDTEHVQKIISFKISAKLSRRKIIEQLAKHTKTMLSYTGICCDFKLTGIERAELVEIPDVINYSPNKKIKAILSYDNEEYATLKIYDLQLNKLLNNYNIPWLNNLILYDDQSFILFGVRNKWEGGCREKFFYDNHGKLLVHYNNNENDIFGFNTKYFENKVFFIGYPKIECFNFKTGKLLWENKIPEKYNYDGIGNTIEILQNQIKIQRYSSSERQYYILSFEINNGKLISTDKYYPIKEKLRKDL